MKKESIFVDYKWRDVNTHTQLSQKALDIVQTFSWSLHRLTTQDQFHCILINPSSGNIYQISLITQVCMEWIVTVCYQIYDRYKRTGFLKVPHCKLISELPRESFQHPDRIFIVQLSEYNNRPLGSNKERPECGMLHASDFKQFHFWKIMSRI